MNNSKKDSEKKKLLVGKKEAIEEVVGKMNEVLSKDKFMVAFWTQGEDGNIVMQRVTWDFPIAYFLRCIRMLANDCLGDVGNCVVDGMVPLPRVEIGNNIRM